MIMMLPRDWLFYIVIILLVKVHVVIFDVEKVNVAEKNYAS